MYFYPQFDSLLFIRGYIIDFYRQINFIFILFNSLFVILILTTSHEMKEAFDFLVENDYINQDGVLTSKCFN